MKGTSQSALYLGPQGQEAHFRGAALLAQRNFRALLTQRPSRKVLGPQRSQSRHTTKKDHIHLLTNNMLKNLCLMLKIFILDPGLLEGVFSNRPCPFMSVSVFKYLRDHLLVFSNFLQKLRHHKGIKVTEFKKILGVLKWEKNPILGAFLMFFVHISASSH